MVTARRQVETLAPAREQYRHGQSLLADRNALEELSAGIDSYRERRRIGLLEQHIETLDTRADGLEGEIGQRQGTFDNHTRVLRELERIAWNIARQALQGAVSYRSLHYPG
uniref:Uncharacterized protein n=1 Tax=Candidatus Kentrum sp. FW TaxID=2126338 RepID=A0A450S960_9GAMM|nr:MAG: hypothetical protein BECKFW1821A_GA0114235_10204 [Candidatus Kentron sp. FW]